MFKHLDSRLARVQADLLREAGAEPKAPNGIVFVISSLEEEFFGLNETEASWFLDTEEWKPFPGTIGPLALSPEFAAAYERFLSWRPTPMRGGSIGAAEPGRFVELAGRWGPKELHLLADFFPPSDPIWPAFLSSAQYVWESSPDLSGLLYCKHVWQAVDIVLGSNVDAELRGKVLSAYRPRWEDGVSTCVTSLRAAVTTWLSWDRDEFDLQPLRREVIAANSESLVAFFEQIDIAEIRSKGGRYFAETLDVEYAATIFPEGGMVADGIRQILFMFP